jgi:hypothetical protein
MNTTTPIIIFDTGISRLSSYISQNQMLRREALESVDPHDV